MGAVSLKLPDELLEASGRCAEALQIPRAEYMRRAIERMNRETQKRLGAQRLAEASSKVCEESMRVKSFPPDDEGRERFRKEALALSRLNHPNMATVHDFGLASVAL